MTETLLLAEINLKRRVNTRADFISNTPQHPRSIGCIAPQLWRSSPIDTGSNAGGLGAPGFGSQD